MVPVASGGRGVSRSNPIPHTLGFVGPGVESHAPPLDVHGAGAEGLRAHRNTHLGPLSGALAGGGIARPNRLWLWWYLADVNTSTLGNSFGVKGVAGCLLKFVQ